MNQLRRQTTEDYLKAIYLLQVKNNFVRAVDIAAYFNVSRATVSIHIKNLSREGFLFVNNSYGINLTEKGKQIAVAIVDKHKIFKQLLEDLGVDEEIADYDARRLEHAISPESYAALKKLAEQKIKQD